MLSSSAHLMYNILNGSVFFMTITMGCFHLSDCTLTWNFLGFFIKFWWLYLFLESVFLQSLLFVLLIWPAANIFFYTLKIEFVLLKLTECVEAFKANTMRCIIRFDEFVIHVNWHILDSYIVAFGHFLKHMLELLMPTQFINLYLSQPKNFTGLQVRNFIIYALILHTMIRLLPLWDSHLRMDLNLLQAQRLVLHHPNLD